MIYKLVFFLFSIFLLFNLTCKIYLCIEIFNLCIYYFFFSFNVLDAHTVNGCLPAEQSFGPCLTCNVITSIIPGTLS